jgi:hypothetical protein
MKRQFLIALGLAAALTVGAAGTALAGSPHFVDGTVTASRTGDTLTVAFKEAGLGDEAQVHVVLSATASCVNGGGNHPQAANKESVNAAGDFPVQHGSTSGELSVTAVFQPPCAPPMTTLYTDVTLTDVTSGISTTLPGTF